MWSSTQPGRHVYRTRPARGGFTLVELIVSLSVGVIISGIAGSLVWNASKIRGDLAARSELVDVAAGAMELMVRHVREIPQDECPGQPSPCLNGKAQIDVAGASELRFGETGFRRQGDELQMSQDGGSAWHLVVDDVAALAFTYFDREGTALASLPLSQSDRENVRLIRIELHLSRGGQSAVLRTATYLRSFMNEVETAP
ncbi:MAG: hypothetical protein DCC65_01515 [Planctomycetota bacterium]|nr:MAG: hypothetical protein DCC65_01515 [Planctomycetota bacterium]